MRPAFRVQTGLQGTGRVAKVGNGFLLPDNSAVLSGEKIRPTYMTIPSGASINGLARPLPHSPSELEL